MQRKRRTICGAQAAVLAILVAAIVCGPTLPASAAGRPSRPTGLRAVRTTAGSVTLRWSPSAGATSYRVIRNGGVRARGVSRASFRDGAVSRFMAYSYSVAACNGAGCSGRSATVTVVTPGGACRGVGLTPRSNIQRAINGRRSGTTFCLAGGTYHVRAPIVPKSYDVMWGARGAVLTGGGTSPGALVGYTHYQHNVRVRGLTIQLDLLAAHRRTL